MPPRLVFAATPFVSSSLFLSPSLCLPLSCLLSHVPPSYYSYCFCSPCKCHIVYLLNLRFFRPLLLHSPLSLSLSSCFTLPLLTSSSVTLCLSLSSLSPFHSASACFSAASLPLLILLFAFRARLLCCICHNTTCHTSSHVVQHRLRPPLTSPPPPPVAAFDLLPLIYLCTARHSQYFIFAHGLRRSFPSLSSSLLPVLNQGLFIETAQNHLRATHFPCVYATCHKGWW